MKKQAGLVFWAGLGLLLIPSLIYATVLPIKPAPIPPPAASFDSTHTTSLHADATLSGNASNLVSNLVLHIAPLGTQNIAYSANGVPVSNNRWSVHITPPLSTGTYIATLTSGTTTLATSTLTIGLHSLPTIQPVTSLPTYDVADGRLMRFSIRGGATGAVAIEKISFLINPVNATVDSIGLYGFSDSGYTTPFLASSTATTSLNSQLVSPTSTLVSIIPDNLIEIPQGTTYYFELDGNVTPTDTSYSVETTLLGDQGGSISTALAEASSSNFVWSPNTYTVSSTTDQDWLNAQVLAMPASGFVQTREGTPIPITPTCTMASDTIAVPVGQPATATWTSTDATSAKWSDGVSANTTGSRTFILSASATYDLTVTNAYGSTDCPVTIELPIPAKAAATSTAPTPDTLAVTPSSGTATLSTTFTATVNNAKSCSALTYTLGYGDGTASITISVVKNLCKAQVSTFTHSYTKTGTFTAALYQGTGTSTNELIQKLTITVTTKVASIDTKSNLASVASAASSFVHEIYMYIVAVCRHLF